MLYLNFNKFWCTAIFHVNAMGVFFSFLGFATIVWVSFYPSQTIFFLHRNLSRDFTIVKTQLKKFPINLKLI